MASECLLELLPELELLRFSSFFTLVSSLVSRLPPELELLEPEFFELELLELELLVLEYLELELLELDLFRLSSLAVSPLISRLMDVPRLGGVLDLLTLGARGGFRCLS
jgi:hypothetical protein